MKFFTTLILSMLLSLSVFANDMDYLKTVNLEGMRIVELQTQKEVFGHDLKYTSHLTVGQMRAMAKAYNFNMVSRFFISSRSVPKYDTIVATIGEVEGIYQLIIFLISGPQAYAIVYDVKKIENNKLIVEISSENNTTTYEVTANQLFPAK